MPTTLTAADIVSKFNTIVRNGVAGTAANWHSGAFPQGTLANQTVTSNDLGSSAPPAAKTEADLAMGATESAITNVYFRLHHWAMELTRIRRGRNIFVQASQPNTTATVTTTTGVVALIPGLELYFPMPTGYPPAPGSTVTSANMDAFCTALRDQVLALRSSSTLFHNFTSVQCHASCHGSCHGSRGRR